MSNLALSRRLWRWVSFSKMLSSLTFNVVSISRNKLLNFTLLLEAEFSRASIKDATKWWGSELQTKIGSSTRWSCRRKQISGHVSLARLLYLCLWRSLLGHRLIQSRILLSFWKLFVDLYTWYWKRPACQREFLEFDIRSSDRYFLLVHCKWLNIAPSLTCCWRKFHN